MFQLHDKVALVTGAAQGMGKADAIALASQGAKVILTDRKIDLCKKVAAEIQSKGGEAACFEMDVSSKAQVEKVFADVIKQYGKIDILVNNAGIFAPKMALDLTEEEWEQTMAINLKGQFLCAQQAAKDMARRKWGRIINISSVASGSTGIGFPGAAHYTASKGGIIGMSETLAIEWAPHGITVNVIAPGAIDTPMVEGAKMTNEVKEALFAHIPLKRMGKPEEIAAAVVFLSSEEASYVTGATLYVDGGWLAN